MEEAWGAVMSVEFEALATTLYPTMQTPSASAETLLAGGEQPNPAVGEQKPATGEHQPVNNAQPANAEPPKPAEVPEAVNRLRDAPERKMYSAEGTYRDALKRTAFADVDPAADKAVNAEAANIFADLGIGNTEAATVVGLVRAHGEAGDETVAGWEAESNTFLATLGKDARESLQLARTLVQRDPRVAAVLDQTGLGSHPDVVKMLIEKAKSARLRGEI